MRRSMPVGLSLLIILAAGLVGWWTARSPGDKHGAGPLVAELRADVDRLQAELDARADQPVATLEGATIQRIDGRLHEVQPVLDEAGR